MGAEKKSWKPFQPSGDASGHGDERTSYGVVASIPSSKISVDISLPLPEMKLQLINLFKDLFEKWSSLDDSQVSVDTVSGGITNLLLKASVQETSGYDVFLTVRLYGPNTDLVIDRKRELQALPYLSAAGFGAKLLGLFANGMVQTFLDARTLSPQDMSIPKIAAEIARQLHKFHLVEVPGSRESQLWNDIFKFLKKAESLEFDEKEKQDKYRAISFKEICNEVNKLKVFTYLLFCCNFMFLDKITEHACFASEQASHVPAPLMDVADLLNAPVVFSHNDLLSGNIMLNDEQGKLYFIDFEYGSYSYRGYDIANHFNEYAGLDGNYNLYPGIEAQYHFFRNYLNPERPHDVSKKDLDALFVETNTFRLASHMYWALWALIQASVSRIEFDYLGYFFLRYNEYKQQKEACFALARKHISG